MLYRPKRNRNHSIKRYLIGSAMAILLLVALLFRFSKIARADQHPAVQAWQSAETRNTVTWTSRIEQRTVPLPTLENVGLKTLVENIYIEGTADRAAESLEMRLWSENGNVMTGGGSIDVRVNNGISEGRANGQEWQAIAGGTDFFAPAGDPLGYLHSAENFTALETVERNDRTITKYRFDINSTTFALQMRDRYIEQQTRTGSPLPTGAQPHASPQLLQMVASGELWVDDATGLPVRQIIETTMPPNEYDQVHATITTDFGAWAEPGAAPVLPLFGERLSTAIRDFDTPAFVATSTVLTTALLFTIALLFFGRNPHAYRTFTAVMIFAMVVVPLLNAAQVHAFSVESAETHAQQQAKDAADRAQQRHDAGIKDPTAATPDIAFPNPQRDNIIGETIENLETLLDTLPLVDTEDDPDGDGVLLSQELVAGTDPNNADSDGDTLNDYIEINELGTNPTNPDTDGDGLNDGAEVTGYAQNPLYKLDPLNPDTNFDGLRDGQECSADGTVLTCPDTDNDGTPDLADLDNDGDGVPDSDDSAPNLSVGNPTTGLADNQFSYAIEQLAPDRAAYIDFQLRPTDADHLWYTNTILDWMDGDREGNIQRVFDTTFYDSLTDEQRATAPPNSKNGDMRLVPMLEVHIPFNSILGGNLPILPDAPAITASTPISEWVDLEETNSFNISLRKAENGDIYAYIPLILQHNEDAQQPVAFGGRMFYRPNSPTWGDAHTAKFVWLLEGITDSCTEPPEDETVAEWCEDDANWVANGNTIIHIYEDEWVLTGFNVREDHGAEVAIISENPTARATGDFSEESLWGAAQGLEMSFVQGTNDGSNRTVTTANLDSATFNAWGLPTDSLNVTRVAFDHQVQQVAAGQGTAQSILDGLATTAADSTTLLYAREETFRSFALDSTGILPPSRNAQAVNGRLSDNELIMEVDPDEVVLITTATLHHAPYETIDGTLDWQPVNPGDYWTHLETDLDTALENYYDEDGAEGALLLARLNYFTLYHGISEAVEFDGQFTAGFNRSDGEISDYLGIAGAPNGWAIDNIVQNFNALLYDIELAYIAIPNAVPSPFAEMTSQPDAASINGKGSASKGGSLYSFGESIYDAVDELVSDAVTTTTTWNVSTIITSVQAKFIYNSTQRTIAKVVSSDWATRAFTTIGILLVLGSFAPQILSLFQIELSVAVQRIITTVVKSVSIVVGLVGLAFTIAKITLLVTATGSLTNALRAVQEQFARTSALNVGIIVVLSIVVAIGFFIYNVISAGISVSQLAFTRALAGLIASIIVSLLFVALSFVPLVGALISGIIGLIDGVISLICHITQAQGVVAEWICPGISGLLGKAVEFLIFAQNPLVDIARDGRLDFQNWSVSLDDPVAGYVAANPVTVAFDVTNALYRPAFKDSPLASSWRWQWEIDDFQQWSRFEYSLSRDKQSHAASLTLNEGDNPWRAPLASDYAPESDAILQAAQRVTATVQLPDPGINRPLSLYLNEEYIIAAQECWGLAPTGGCYIRGDDFTTHIEIGSNLIFDVLPRDISGFMELVDGGTVEDSYRQAFADGSRAHPILQDADGDGLRSAFYGGIDPNDSNPDSDGDLLNDFFEIQNGLDPLDADSDDDTVLDGEEIRLGTDPFSGDSDLDSLGDADELIGWEVVYGYSAAGDALKTWVWPDPTSADFDGDTYLDSDEMAYGFHPGSADFGTLLDLRTNLSAPTVAPGSPVDLTTILTNNLRARTAFGLHRTVLPNGLTTADATDSNFVLLPEATGSETLSIDTDAATTQQLDVTTSIGAVAVDLSEGQSLWLKLDETSGTDFLDSSFNGNNATCTNCPALGQAGVNGNALDFNGSDDALTLTATTADLGMRNNPYTVLAWVKAEDFSSIHPVVGTDGEFFETTFGFAAGRPYAKFGSGATYSAPDALATGEWHRVAWRFDGDDTLSFWVNGNEVHSATTTANPTRGTLVIGATGRSVDGYFDGLIDDLEILPYAADDDDLTQEWGDQIFYYRFDKTSVNENESWLDDSGLGNTITCLEAGLENTPYCPTGAYSNDGVIDGAHSFGSESAASVLLAEGRTQYNLSRGVGAFTIAAWARPQYSGHIVGNEITGDEYPYLWVDSFSDNSSTDPRQIIQIEAGFENGTACRVETGSITMPSGEGLEWKHFAASYDGSILRVYLDGAEQAQTNCNGLQPPDLDYFLIGHDNDSSLNAPQTGSAYGGLIDELRLFNYALSAENIATLAALNEDTLRLRGSAELTFDEAPGQTTLRDSSLSGLDATCTNCPLTGVPGLFGQSVIFGQTGFSEELDLGTSGQLGIAEGFAVSAWVYMADEPNPGRFIYRQMDSSSQIELGLALINDTPQLIMPELTVGALEAPNPLSRERWHHIVWTYDQGANVGTRTIYVNGLQVAQDTFNRDTDVTTGDWPLENDSPVEIGVALRGKLDQLQIFNNPISSDRVWQLYSEAPGVVLHLDEPAGSTSFADAGDFAFDGTSDATCTGDSCPAAGTAGRVYQGVHFDGNDRLDIPYSYSSLLDFNQFSVGMWVRPEIGQGGVMPLIAMEKEVNPYADRTFGLSLNAVTKALDYTMAGCNGGTSIDKHTDAQLVSGTWNHVMLTYDGLSTSDNVIVYLNGVPIHTSTVTGERCNAGSTDTGIVVGSSSGTHQFVGQIDEIIVDSSVFSAERIANIVARDTGWINATVTTPILVDRDNPMVEIMLEGDYLPRSEQIIAIEISDATSEIVSAQYTINGGTAVDLVRDVDVWLLPFNPPTAGSYDLAVTATDAVGNSGSAQKTVIVDNTGATVTLDAAAMTPQLTHDQPDWSTALSGSATSSGSPVASLTVQLVGGDNNFVGPVIDVAVAAGAWSLDYPFPTRNNGTFMAHLVAHDGVGNRTETTESITIDGNAPFANVQLPTAETGQIEGLMTLSGSVTDATGVEKVEVSFRPLDQDDQSPVRIYDSGNVLHLTMEDNPGSAARATNLTFVDSSDSGNDAICDNCPTSAERGKLGNGARFDGLDDALRVTEIAASLTSGAYSFGGWVSIEPGTGDQALFAFKNSDSVPTAALLYRHGTNRFVYQDAVVGEAVAGSSHAPGQWVHVWVSVAADNGGVLYVNGDIVAAFTTTSRPAAGNALVLGRAWDGSGYRYLDGILDDMAVYDAALSSAEVKRLYRGMGAVLHLGFDEPELADRGKVADASRYDNETTLFTNSGTTLYTLNGSDGLPNAAVGAGAYRLDGLNDYLQVAEAAHLDLSDGEFTQMVWAYVDPTDAGALIGGPQYAGDRTVYPSIAVDGGDVTVGFGDGILHRTFTANGVLTTGAWNHIATSFDGTTYRLFVNGDEVATSGDFAGTAPFATTEVYLGTQYCDVACPFLYEYFGGGIDAVAVYRQVLSPVEIAALYHEGWHSAEISASGNGITNAAWGYHVPAGLEGYYEIVLRSADVLANGGTGSFGKQGNGSWEGYINTVDLVGAAGLPTAKFELWLQAQTHTIESANAVHSWGDLSGNDNHAAQSADSSRPLIVNNINGQPALRFDGSNDFLEIVDNDTLDFETDDSFHIFAVVESTDTSSGAILAKDDGNEGFWWTRHNTGQFRLWVQEAGGASSNVLPSTRVNVVEPHIILIQRDATADELRILFDATPARTTTDATAQTLANDSPVRIGRFNAGTYALDGDIAELIVMRGDLSAAEIDLIHNYLSGRYNIPIAADYYAGDETVNGDYDFAISGIGQTAGERVEMAKSAGLDLANGSPARSSGIINEDGDYAIVGYDGSANGVSADNLAAGTTSRWQRDWYLDVTEAGSPGGSLALTFDVSEAGLTGLWTFAGDASELQLLYRPNRTANFTVLAATATVNGDRTTFTLTAAEAVDGYYTLGSTTFIPTAVTLTATSTDSVQQTAWLIGFALLGATWLLFTRHRKHPLRPD